MERVRALREKIRRIFILKYLSARRAGVEQRAREREGPQGPLRRMSDAELDGANGATAPFEMLMGRLLECMTPDFVEQLKETTKVALLKCPWRLLKFIEESAMNVKDLVATSFDTTTPAGRVQAKGYEIMLEAEVRAFCLQNDALRPDQRPEKAAVAPAALGRCVAQGGERSQGKLPAPTESNSPESGKSKRLKITPKIEHAYQLTALPAELVASAERLVRSVSAEDQVLREVQTRPWVRQAMEWCVSQGVLNQTDNAGVLGKVGC